MKRSVGIEWLKNEAGVLRVHLDADSTHGADYDWFCVIEKIGDVAMLHGAIDAPSPSQFRAISAALKGHGFSAARWKRIGADGATKIIDWNLT